MGSFTRFRDGKYLDAGLAQVAQRSEDGRHGWLYDNGFGESQNTLDMRGCSRQIAGGRLGRA